MAACSVIGSPMLSYSPRRMIRRVGDAVRAGCVSDSSFSSRHQPILGKSSHASACLTVAGSMVLLLVILTAPMNLSAILLCTE